MKSVEFVKAFLFEPSYYSEFVVKGRTYTYDGIIRTHNDVLVVCHYFNKYGNIVHKVLAQSVYKNERVYFL